MGWGIFEKLFSKQQRSASQPALKTTGMRKPANNNNRAQRFKSMGDTSFSASSSVPDLASRIGNKRSLSAASSAKTKELSESLSRSKPARPTYPPSKSFGEDLNNSLNPDNVDTDEEVHTNFSPRSTQDKTADEKHRMSASAKGSTLTSRSGYQSSESSSESKGRNPNAQPVFKDTSGIFTAQSASNQTKQRRASTSESVASTTEPTTSVTPSLSQQHPTVGGISASSTGNKKQIGNLDHMHSFGQVSAVANTTGNNSRLILSQSVTFREPESTVLGQSGSEKSNVKSLSTSTKNATDKNTKEMNASEERLEKVTQEKRELDLLMAKFYDGVTSPSEKEELKKLFISKQQVQNEKVMNEQARIIEALQARCKKLRSSRSADSQPKDQEVNYKLKSELEELKNLVYRLTRTAEEKDQKIAVMQTRLDSVDTASKDAERIRKQAEVVLEENQILREQAELRENRFIDAEKSHVKEIGRLAKRIILAESDKVNLQNQLQLFSDNHDTMLAKYNQSSLELNRRITLEDHLKQIGQVTRKLEETNLKHKEEMQENMLLLQASQGDKESLSAKNASLLAENKKLSAENQVLEKALEEGIGRKAQRKLHDLERRLATAEHNERIAQAALIKLAHETQKMKQQRKNFLQLAKSSELEARKNEQRVAQENLKANKLEEKLEIFKEKAASTLAKTMQKNDMNSEKFSQFKLENDKKLTDIVNLLERKQSQLDTYIQEKKILESEVENFCQTTMHENKKFKDVLLDL